MKDYLHLIKFPHTVFALPFALLGFFIGIHSGGVVFSVKLLVLVILCMIFARSAAMAFNRYADRGFDSQNLRTKNREIPSGVIKPFHALVFTIANSLAFVLTTYFINRTCFYLSPVALLIILGYSYTKRFTPLCHLILGLGLAMAPVGAFLAVNPVFETVPVLLGITVLFWVGGFDIIYALQDEEFDKDLNLYSIPALVGKSHALTVSRLLHLVCGILLLILIWIMTSQYDNLSWLTYTAVFVFTGLLAYQHSLVRSDDLSRVNLAFFTVNGYASITLCSLIVLDFYL